MRYFAFMLLVACAPDLRDEYPFDGALMGTDFLKNVVQSDGTTLSTIDATHKDSFVYVDLETGTVVTVADAWDLSFQRYKISANGGASGTGNVRVAVIKDGDFDAMKKAPADGYQQDAADPVFNGPEGGWYVYDLGKHQLVTREDLFYVVDTGDAFFKVKMKSYYDAAGTPAKMQFVWAKIDVP